MMNKPWSTLEKIGMECKSYLNISPYENENTDNETKEKEEYIEDQEFPAPVKVQRNKTFGKYLVASRRIEDEELICKESPVFVGPSSDPNPYCIGCYENMQSSNKCSKCEWPVCNTSCENMPSHAENECKVLSENNIFYNGCGYFYIEVLRCLLSREKFPKKWAILLQKEAHRKARREDPWAVENLLFITDFVRNKCKLIEFDEDTIDKVVGVLSVNTYGTFRDLNRHASLLFDKSSLITHDCHPNTLRNMLHHPQYEGRDWANGLEVYFHAARTIEKGEVISTYYVDITKDVKERRAELKEIFYFDCCCKRCLVELMEVNSLGSEIVENL